MARARTRDDQVDRRGAAWRVHVGVSILLLVSVSTAAYATPCGPVATAGLYDGASFDDQIQPLVAGDVHLVHAPTITPPHRPGEPARAREAADTPATIRPAAGPRSPPTA
jgi:hypothetical protein